MNYKQAQALEFVPIHMGGNDHLVCFDLGIVYCVTKDAQHSCWRTRRVERFQDGQYSSKWQFKHVGGTWQDQYEGFSDALENRYKEYVVENHVFGDTHEEQCSMPASSEV